MAFIRNTDKFVEGLSNKFFTDGRAQLALQETVTSLEGEDSGMKLRLDVIEGGAGVSGSIAKAQADAQSYADQKIAALVNSAPEVLDTLKELSDAIGGDQNFAATVSGQIGAVDAKVDQEVLDRQAAISTLQSSVSGDVSSLQSADSALSLRLDQLELDPVTKSYVDSQDSSESSARQSADSALSGRLDTLEQDPTTKTYVDGGVSGLQGQITQEISDRQSGDNALSGRLDIIEGAGEGSVAKAEQDAKDYADGLDSAMDARMLVLEADPTTKSYVDSADSALSGRLDVLEADPVEKTYVDSQDSGLQSQIDTEKGRIDAILSASEADKDSFAEIVNLINSVDTENDSAFAGYVSSNDAALAQEVSDRQAGDSALSGRLDVLEADPTTKSYVDGEVDALEAEDLTMFKKDGSRDLEGTLKFSAETFNIGTASANRPNEVYVKGGITVGNKRIYDATGGLGLPSVFIDGGIRAKYNSKSANYTLNYGDYIIGVTDVAASPVMTLPSPVFAGIVLVVKDMTGSASDSNYIEIVPPAGKLIDGESNYKITVPYESVTFVSNGANWFIM